MRICQKRIVSESPSESLSGAVQLTTEIIQCVARTNHWSTLGDLVVDGLLDDPIDIWFVRLSPISRVRSHDACSLSGDPVRDAARRRFCVDLR